MSNINAGGRFLNIREKFPFFTVTKSKNPNLLDSISRIPAYLDSGASAQKPRAVIDRIKTYLSSEHANIHRGAYHLSAESTESYENARGKIAQFIGSPDCNSVIFTKGATESINLVSYALEDYFNAKDTILVSLLEHHSNFVPWQQLAKRRKCRIEYVDINPDGTININDLKDKIVTFQPKLLAITQLSNIFGSVTPLEEVIEISHKNNVLVLVDAAQSICHLPINVELLNVDFLAFSGHKLYGPTGIGILYVAPRLKDLLEPFQTGGGMIEQVSIEGTTWAEFPKKFEAGTPPIAEAIGLKTAIEFLESFGMSEIQDHEHSLLLEGLEILSKVPNIKIYGPTDNTQAFSSILSFNLKGVHPHDIATVCDSHNIQVRAGHHCCMPALKRLGIAGTVRASIGIYTLRSDFERLALALVDAQKVFA